MIEVTNLYPNRKPRKQIVRKPDNRTVSPKKAPRKRRKTKSDMWAEFGLKRPPKPRYSGLRGVLWYVFSKFIRERDKDLPCINCGLMKEDRHAGHFIPTGKCGWDGMVFDDMNVHSECSSCNLRDKRKMKYGVNLDRLYPGERRILEDIYSTYITPGNSFKNFSADKYRSLIAEYTKKLEELGTIPQ